MKLYKKIKQYWRGWELSRITPETVKELSLYPECPQKSLRQIRSELFWLYRNPKRSSWVFKDTTQNYFDMGLDRKGENIRKYVFSAELHIARIKKQPLTAAILNDKWVTSQYLQSCGIATTNSIVVKTPFVTDEEVLSKIKQSGETKFFAKIMDGFQGRGAFPFTMIGNEFIIDGKTISEADLVKRLDGYIVESLIDQHEALNEICPHTVSSLRVVTVCNEDNVDVVISLLFMGAGDAHTSNLFQGGIMLSVNESGEVGEVGVKAKINRGRYRQHPDTGFVFKGFKVPYWKEVTELAKNAHKCFPKIHSIGWDIAITKNGPIIIEGNRHWVTCPFQFVNGPGREYLKKWFKLRY